MEKGNMTLEAFLAEWNDERDAVLVYTSGSTGLPRPMMAEKRRMEASARITCDFLGLKAGDRALLCMPLDFIAGKMMVVRALVAGLQLVAVEPVGAPEWEGGIDFAAMVPLQVWNLMQQEQSRKRLMAVRHLIIGGGAIDEGLAQRLADFPNAVWSTYGMTETLSHVALRRLNGPDRSEWYTPFSGVSLSLDENGCLLIDAPAVHDGPLATHDLAELSADGRFRILGRKDNVICSGGIKIQIEEVERALRPHFKDIPYIITRAHDEKFGQVVVMLTSGLPADAEEICRRVLPKYWQPRRYFHVAELPFTRTGKPCRAEAEALAKAGGAAC